MPNTSYVLEPFRRGHLDEVLHAGIGLSHLRVLADAVPMFERGRAYTGREAASGHIIACAGIISPWRGMGEVWALPTALALTAYRVAYARCVRRVVREIAAREGLRRVESVISEEFPQGKRWMEFLGFELESVMPLFGLNGETHYRYVWFPD